MAKAISDWLNKTPDGDRFNNNGERMENMQTYAAAVGIPYKSLYKYIHPTLDKRQQLGDGTRGKAKILADDDVTFIVPRYLHKYPLNTINCSNRQTIISASRPRYWL